jgi:uncharacterized membrane protein
MSKVLFWVGIPFIGFVLGCFMRPRTVVITGAVLMTAGVAVAVFFGKKQGGGRLDDWVGHYSYTFGTRTAWVGASIVALLNKPE